MSVDDIGLGLPDEAGESQDCDGIRFAASLPTEASDPIGECVSDERTILRAEQLDACAQLGEPSAQPGDVDLRSSDCGGSDRLQDSDSDVV